MVYTNDFHLYDWFSFTVNYKMPSELRSLELLYTKYRWTVIGKVPVSAVFLCFHWLFFAVNVPTFRRKKEKTGSKKVIPEEHGTVALIKEEFFAVRVGNCNRLHETYFTVASFKTISWPRLFSKFQ